MEVQTYVLNKQVDFNIYDSEPTFLIQEFFGSTLLDKYFRYTQFLPL